MANQIVAMTYNVCFGCMLGSKGSTNYTRDGTALYIATHCYHNRNCLNNIKTTFDNVLSNSKYGSLDLVGIQEASKWQDIIEAISLKNLICISSREINEDMVSLYNPTKFTLDYVTSGNTKPGDGRPGQILLLTEKTTNEKYMFINVHFAHLQTKKQLEDSLDKIIKGLYVQGTGTNLDLVSTKGSITLDDKTIKSYNKVIFMGDTNDHGTVNLWKGFKINGETTKSIKPPNTCCVPESGKNYLRGTGGLNDSKLGDYILINDKLNFITNNEVPMGFNTNGSVFPTSDHLPVVAVINSAAAGPAAAPASWTPPRPPQPAPASWTPPRPPQPAPASWTPTTAPPPLPPRQAAAQEQITYNLKQEHVQKTLRLLNLPDDPNKSGNHILYGVQFKSSHNLKPNEDVHIIFNTDSDYVLIQMISNSNIKGYVNRNYLTPIPPPPETWGYHKLKSTDTPKTLRLTQDDKDPNMIPYDNKHKGKVINDEVNLQLIYDINSSPVNFVRSGKTYNLVRSLKGYTGYVNSAYLVRITSGGSRKKRTLKTKKNKSKKTKTKKTTRKVKKSRKRITRKK